MNEQLVVRISGREFGISLTGYNEQAGAEIRELFTRRDTDLLTLLSAYLDAVHKKCELESRIQAIDSKIEASMRTRDMRDLATSRDLPLDGGRIDGCELDECKLDECGLESIDSSKPSAVAHTENLQHPQDTQDQACSLFESQKTEPKLAQKDAIA